MTNDEFMDFVNNGDIKTLNNYVEIQGKRVNVESERAYVVGKTKINKQEDVVNNIHN